MSSALCINVLGTEFEPQVMVSMNCPHGLRCGTFPQDGIL
jgi:hypothetical protein